MAASLLGSNFCRNLVSTDPIRLCLHRVLMHQFSKHPRSAVSGIHVVGVACCRRHLPCLLITADSTRLAHVCAHLIDQTGINTLPDLILRLTIFLPALGARLLPRFLDGVVPPGGEAIESLLLLRAVGDSLCLLRTSHSLPRSAAAAAIANGSGTGVLGQAR